MYLVYEKIKQMEFANLQSITMVEEKSLLQALCHKDSQAEIRSFENNLFPSFLDTGYVSVTYMCR